MFVKLETSVLERWARISRHLPRLLVKTPGNLMEAKYKGVCHSAALLFEYCVLFIIILFTQWTTSKITEEKKQFYLENSPYVAFNYAKNQRLTTSFFFLDFLLTEFQPRCTQLHCVFVYTWLDLPLQTSYLGRCSSLHLLWSCSKPWRSPESSPGLDQSSTRLEKTGGVIRVQHIWSKVYTWFYQVLFTTQNNMVLTSRLQLWWIIY